MKVFGITEMEKQGFGYTYTIRLGDEACRGSVSTLCSCASVGDGIMPTWRPESDVATKQGREREVFCRAICGGFVQGRGCCSMISGPRSPGSIVPCNEDASRLMFSSMDLMVKNDIGVPNVHTMTGSKV